MADDLLRDIFGDEVQAPAPVAEPADNAPEPAPAAPAPVAAPPVAPAPTTVPTDEDLITNIFGAAPAAPAPTVAPESKPPAAAAPNAFVRGLYQGGVKQNLDALRDAAEMAAVLGDNETAQKVSDAVRQYSDSLDKTSAKDMQLQVPSTADIYVPGKGVGETLSRAGTFAAEQLGSGLGSSGPALGAGLAVGAATSETGPGAVLAGLATAAGVSYLQNAPQVYRGLLDAGLTDKVKAAKWALAAGVPISALDAVGDKIPLARALGAGGEQLVKRAIYKRIAVEAAKSAGFEGTTEAIQQMIQDATTYGATGKDQLTKENAIGWLDNFAGGAISGGALGGAAGVKPDKVKAEAPVLTDPGQKSQADQQPPEGTTPGPGVAGPDQGQPSPGGTGIVAQPPVKTPAETPGAAIAGGATETGPVTTAPVDPAVTSALPGHEDDLELDDNDEEDAGDLAPSEIPPSSQPGQVPRFEDQKNQDRADEDARKAALRDLLANRVDPAVEQAATQAAGSAATPRGEDQVAAIVDGIVQKAAQAKATQPAPAPVPGPVPVVPPAEVAAGPEAVAGAALPGAPEAQPVAEAPAAVSEIPPRGIQEPGTETPGPLGVEPQQSEAALTPEPILAPAAPAEAAKAVSKKRGRKGGEALLAPESKPAGLDLLPPSEPTPAAMTDTGPVEPAMEAETTTAAQPGPARPPSDTAPVRVAAPAPVSPATKPVLKAPVKPTRELGPKEQGRKVEAAKPVQAATVEHVTKPSVDGKRKSAGVRGLIGDGVRGALEEYGHSPDVARRAFEQAMAEHADEADSSQHENVAKAARALAEPVRERASKIADQLEEADTEAEVKGKAAAHVAGLEAAKAKDTERRLEGSGQERARAGKVKGKELEAYAAESQPAWERRMLEEADKGDASARHKEVQALRQQRKQLWGGDAKAKAEPRQAIAERLKELRAQDLAEKRASAPAPASEEQKQAARQQALADTEANLRRTEQEREDAAAAAAARSDHSVHDKILEEVSQAVPKPEPDKLGRLSGASYEAAMRDHASAFANALLKRIGKIPDKVRATQSKAQNFLARANQIRNGPTNVMTSDGIDPETTPAGKATEVTVLRLVMESLSGPEFYRELMGAQPESMFHKEFMEAETQGDLGETGRQLPSGMSSEMVEADATVARGSKGVVSFDGDGLQSLYGEVSVASEDISTLGDVLDKAGDALAGGGDVKNWRWAASGRRTLEGGTRSLFARMQRLVDKVIHARLRDVPVYHVSDEEMRRLTGSQDARVTTRGMWLEPTTADRAKGAKGAVVLNKKSMAEGNSAASIVRHEAVHGITAYAVNNNIDGAQEIMQRMIDEIRDQLPAEMLQASHPEFQYGLTSPHEFVAEAFTNPAFQDFLASMPLSDAMKKTMGDHKLVGRQSQSLWDAFVAAVGKILRLAGYGHAGSNYLEAVIKLQEPSLRADDFISEHSKLLSSTESADEIRSNVFIRRLGETGFRSPGAQHLRQADQFSSGMMASSVMDAINTLVGKSHHPGIGSRLRRGLNYLKTGAQIAEDSEPLWGRRDNPIHNVIDAMRKQGYAAGQIMQTGDSLVSELLRMGKKASGAAREIDDFVHEATHFNVDPTSIIGSASNKHIQKSGLRDQQLRKAHTELRTRYLAMTPAQQGLVGRIRDFYRDTQDTMTRTQVHTMIEELRYNRLMPILPAGKTQQDLEDFVLQGGIDRIGTKGETVDDRAMFDALGKLAVVFKQATMLRATKGFYVPLLRKGQYVNKYKIKLPTPAGASAVLGKHLLFTDKAKLQAFLDSHEEPMAAPLKSYLVDPTTLGRVKATIVDPNNPGKRIANPAAASAVQIYEVSPQTEGFELHESMKEARARNKELRADPGVEGVNAVDIKADLFELAGREIMNATGQKLMKSIDGFSKDAATQTAIERAMQRAIFEAQSTTRIQQRRLRRKGVRGFDKTTARNMADYNISASNFIAKRRAGPTIRDNMTRAEKDQRQWRETRDTDQALRATEIIGAIKKQLAANETYNPASLGTRITHSMMALSFLNHLASAANSMVNAMQVGTVAFPRLASDHTGWGGSLAAMNEIRRAYWGFGGKGVGPLQQLKLGLQNMSPRGGFARIKSPLPTTDTLINRIKDPQERKMLQELQQTHLLGDDAGLELEAHDVRKNAVERGLGLVSEFASKLPQVIENVNRSVTGLAAYRMGVKRGMSHEDAVNYAKDVVNDTQGDYTQQQAPLAFKHPLMRFILQFKKYPQMMMRILGKSLRESFVGESKAVRKAARKQLRYLALTHFVVAGAGGLPFTEVAKMLALLANGLGWDDDDWNDWENKVQGWIKQISNGKVSEVALHGLPRLLGFDLSGRMGLDSLVTFGSPKTVDAAGIKAWLFDATSGAPVGTAAAFLQGIAALPTDPSKTLASLPLPKQLMDIWKAGYQHEYGKFKPSGQPIPGTKLDWWDTAWKAMGFQPASQSRAFEYGGTGTLSKEKVKKTAERSSVMKGWLTAGSGAERAAQWKQIQAWNAGRPAKERITMETLAKAKARRATQTKKDTAAYEETQQ